jgi:hypothetical protein
MTIEDKAAALAADRGELERRLRRERFYLAADVRPRFERARFDYAGRRLISACGTLALQWNIRRNPELPISHENRQTRAGFVALVAL